MNNVAICISGHARIIRLGYQSICNTIICPNPDFEFDIFIHTWSTDSWGKSVYYESLDLFNPEKVVIEDKKTWDASTYLSAPKVIVHPGSDGTGPISMFYKIQSCHKLIDKKYDLVIRTRTDFMWDNEFLLKPYLNCGNKVFVPNGGTIIPVSGFKGVKDIDVIHSSHSVWHNWFSAANDQFAVSSQENMKIYSDTFDNIGTLVSKYGIYCPEALLYQQLADNELEVVPVLRASHLTREDGGVVYFRPH